MPMGVLSSHKLLQYDGGLDASQGAGQPGLNHVLLLVEVDVELIEPGDFAALGSAQGVVRQVHEDTQELVLVGIAVGADKTGKLLGSVDVVDIQRLGQIALGVVDAAAVQISGQQHHIEQMGVAVEVGRPGALILLSGVEGCGNDGLRIDVVIAEIVCGVGALKLLLGRIYIYGVMDGIQVVVIPNGADVLLIDLVLSPSSRPSPIMIATASSSFSV